MKWEFNKSMSSTENIPSKIEARWTETTLSNRIPQRCQNGTGKNESTNLIKPANEVHADLWNRQNIITTPEHIPHRKPSSPRKVQTQRATLVYTSFLEQQRPKSKPSKSNNIIKTTTYDSVSLEKEFHRKKDDRDKEIKEIQDMLSEITKSPKKTPTTITDRIIVQDEVVQAQPEIEPSKTGGVELFPIINPENSPRTGSETQVNGSHVLGVKPNQSMPIDQPIRSQRKLHNSEETRLYMEKQRKKRRSIQKNERNKNSETNPEEIKKRLEDLRKTTRLILTRNVSKAAAAKKHSESTFQQKQKENQQTKVENPQTDSPMKTLIRTSPATKKNSFKECNKAQNEHVTLTNRNFDQNKRAISNISLSKDFLPSGYCVVPHPEPFQLQDVPVPHPTKSSSTQLVSIPSTSSVEPKRSDMDENLSTPNLSGIPLTENFKKIGLLRKLETHDHSFSAIKSFNMDKENVVIEMLTPKLNGASEHRSKEKDIPENSPPSSITRRSQYESMSLNQYKDMQLSVPGGKLKSRTVKQDKDLLLPSTQIKEQKSLANGNHRSEAKTDIPYWLKPSSVQVYPYNFITAVRKKLEAITHPPQASNEKGKRSNPNPESFSSIPISSKQSSSTVNESAEIRKEVCQQKTDTKDLQKKESKVDLPGNNQMANSCSDHTSHHSNSISRIESTFSSISLEVPQSNTISEISSIQSEFSKNVKPSHSDKPQSVELSDNDTTISSSIFSSPKKKTHRSVPNAVKSQSRTDLLNCFSENNISDLNIKTKLQNISEQFSAINVNRGDELIVPRDKLVSSSNESCDGTKSNHHPKEYFSQLLEDFNRSLSQVIEVNHQLKSTLKKSHEIFSPERVKQSPAQKENPIEDYASDFEEELNTSDSASTTIASSRIKTLNTRSINHLEPSIYQLRKSTFLTMADGVKPLVMSSDDNESSNSSLRKSVEVSNESSKQSKTVSIADKVKIPEEIRKASYSSDLITTEISHSTECGTQSSHESVNQQSSKANMASPTQRLVRNSKKYNHKKQDKVESEKYYESLSQKNQNFESAQTTINRKEFLDDKHVNSSRGDYYCDDRKCSSGPPSYSAVAGRKTENVAKASNNKRSDSVPNSLNHSEYEISIVSQNGTLSDSTLNYSSIGMYEKLIQKETTKSERLTTLLRLREKALLDRTKGQIAWLEVQKEKYKSKGLTNHISTIKKKQRAILLKMEKEREEIKRLLQSTGVATTTTATAVAATTTTTHTTSRIHRDHYNFSPAKTTVFGVNTPTTKRLKGGNCSIDRKPQQLLKNKITSTSNASPTAVVRTTKIVRGYELESSRSLEELLQKREEDLRKRREHVERLMKWHQRLDQEEAEVLQLERLLIDYNVNVQQQPQTTSSSKRVTPAINNSDIEESSASTLSHQFPNNKANTHTKLQEKMERKLKEIDKSLRELSNISISSNATDPTGVTNENGEDFVRTTGSKLNKLWRRLTSQHVEKFEANRRYKLCKGDLERLYEEAKYVVLREFGQGDDRIAEFLEKTSYCSSQPSSLMGGIAPLSNSDNVVPRLNLNLSSAEQSDNDQIATVIISQGNYSPSAAEEEFLGGKVEGSKTDTTSTSSLTSSAGQPGLFRWQQGNNYQLSTAHPPSMTNKTKTLQRSLSDTELSTKPAKSANSPFTFSKSQRNISIASKLIETSKNTSQAEKEYLHEEIKSIDISNKLYDNRTETCTNIPSDHQIITQNSSSNNVSAEPPPSPVKSLYSHETSSSIDEVSDISDDQISSNPISISSIEKQPTIDELEREVTITPVDNTIPSAQTEDLISSQNQSSVITLNSNATEIQEEALLSKWDMTTESTIENHSYSESFETSPQTVDTSGTEPTFNTSPENVNDLLKGKDSIDIKEETIIEDLTMPEYETIIEDDIEEEANKNQVEKNILPTIIDTDHLKDNLSSELTSTYNSNNKPSTSYSVALGVSSIYSTSNSIANTPQVQQFIPEIPNEIELRKCQQIMLECEQQMKHFENVTAVPYMYVREIPNKPPPPYVPPAHGSPMTAIFPSEERIKDITYRRTRELYCEMLKTDLIDENGKKIPSVMNEKITNIFERIILDICREYLSERNEVLTKSDPTNFHSPLAFFNPPNRLRCIQDFVYKEIRRCLAMDKKQPKHNKVYSIYGSRAKRDHIGKIIIQEMYEEDDKWCNFHQEESEVINLIIDEMIFNIIKDTASEVLIEEGGSIDTVNETSEDSLMNPVTDSL